VDARPRAARDPAPGGALRILSANLRNGGADPEAFADLVRETGAEVVAVQELAPAQADALARVLGHGQLDPRRDHRGMGIALAHPARHARIRLRFRDAHAVELDPREWPPLAAPLEVLNVHISNAATLRRPLAHVVNRRAQVEGLLAHLDACPERARVLLGDLNSTPLWPLYRRLVSRLDDLHAVHARRSGLRPARTWPRGLGNLRLLRIDHCLGRGCEASRVEVLDLRGSDHCALLVELAT
jgi:endonuclease/exonuclease/phosphatase (EEP) superfamily protein YafD